MEKLVVNAVLQHTVRANHLLPHLGCQSNDILSLGPEGWAAARLYAPRNSSDKARMDGPHTKPELETTATYCSMDDVFVLSLPSPAIPATQPAHNVLS